MEILFHFRFNNPVGFLISFIPAVINLCLLVYTILYLPRNKITNVFALLTLALTCWQISDAMSRISATAETAAAWDAFFAPSWMMMGAICLHFTLLFTGIVPEKYSRLTNTLIYLPSLVFLGLFHSGAYEHHYDNMGFWGWVDAHDRHILDSLGIWWIAVLVILATVLMAINTYRVRKHKDLWNQSFIVMLGISIPALTGIVTQVVMPLIFNAPSIPVASTTMTGLSLAIIIALQRFRLFNVSDLINSENFLDSLPTMVICVNPSQKLIYANEYIRRKLALNKHTLLTYSIDDAITCSNIIHKKALMGIVELALKGRETLNVESSIVTTSGEALDTLMSVRPIINNNEVQGALLSIRDITELKKSSELVTRNAQQLKEAQQIAKLGSWEWDIANNEMTWSDEMYRIFGYEPGAMEISYETYLKQIHPKERQAVNETIQAAYQQNKPFSVYHRTSNNDGTIIHSRGGVTATKDGAPVKMFGTAQDVTETHQKEEQLEKQNEELQKINSELDKFVYSVSHDLRSPLTTMQGLVALAIEETHDAQIREYFHMIASSTAKLDKFIMDILDYSRNARLDIKLHEVNLEELVLDIVGAHTMQAHEVVNIETQVYCDHAFYSDGTRLTMILNNLISNAIRYHNPSTPQPFVKVTADVFPDKALISVIDNGKGIAQDIQPRIFDMFFRGTKESVGSGLGLYIVKEAVEKLGGKVKLDSEPGKGTIFIVEIPNNSKVKSQN